MARVSRGFDRLTARTCCRFIACCFKLDYYLGLRSSTAVAICEEYDFQV